MKKPNLKKFKQKGAAIKKRLTNKPKLPSIFRFIPEISFLFRWAKTTLLSITWLQKGKISSLAHLLLRSWIWFVWGGIYIVAFVLLFSAAAELSEARKQKETADKNYNSVLSELRYWQDITNKYPDFRDAYFKQAISYYELGNIPNTKIYVKKSLELDPNFDKAQQFQKFLQNM